MEVYSDTGVMSQEDIMAGGWGLRPEIGSMSQNGVTSQDEVMSRNKIMLSRDKDDTPETREYVLK